MSMHNLEKWLLGLNLCSFESNPVTLLPSMYHHVVTKHIASMGTFSTPIKIGSLRLVKSVANR